MANNNLKYLFLGGLQELQTQRQKNQELADALLQLKMKAELDPETRLMNYIMGGMGGQQPAFTPQGIMPQTGQQGMGIDQSQLLRGMLSKKFGVPYEQIMTPTEKQAEIKQAQEKTRATKLAEIEATMQPAKNILNTLKTQYFATFPEAPETGKGLKRFSYGLAKGYEAWTESNPAVASYLQTRNAFLSLLVRGLGERGVLTDKDIERINKAIPSQYTTKSVAERNFQTIEDILGSAIQKYGSQGGDMSVVQNIFNSVGNMQSTQQQGGSFKVLRRLR
jgi:hypothetical protein